MRSENGERGREWSGGAEEIIRVRKTSVGRIVISVIGTLIEVIGCSAGSTRRTRISISGSLSKQTKRVS